MKIALTGASGFIGRHVLKKLIEYDVEIIALSKSQNNSDTYACPHLKWCNIDLHQSLDKYYEVLGKPDVLIHLAWAGLPNYQSLHHFETELPRQYDFLSNLIRDGLSNLIVLGTCFEYGMQSGPLSVDMASKPCNPYGYAKDALRKQLEYLKNSYHFHFTWGRLFYLYGEGQSEKSLFGSLNKAVKQGRNTFEMSGGEQLRDYLPVSKVAEIIVNYALNPKDYGIVNICSGKPVSVRSLVEGWIKDFGWNIQLELHKFPYPSHEPMAFWGVPNSTF